MCEFLNQTIDAIEQADALVISVKLYKKIVDIIRNSVDGLRTESAIVSTE